MRSLTTVVGLVFTLAVSPEARPQTLSPDFQSTVHVFPQFVDGVAAPNRFYISTLQVSAAEFYAVTWCTLGLLSMPPTTLSDARGIAQTNTVFNFILGASGWQILESQGERPLRSGSAVLQCDRPVTAHLLYRENADGKVTSEATVSAAAPGRLVQLLADQRRGARLGLAIANPFSALTAYRISAVDINGRLIHVSFAQVAPGGAFTRFLDEFAALPRDYRGPIFIESGSGTDVYAAGLRFTGDTFTAIPAMVRVR